MRALLLLCTAILSFFHVSAQMPKDVLYVRAAGGDIHVIAFDADNIALKTIQTVHADRLPVAMALHPRGRFLFTANKLGLPSMPDWGSVSSYAVDPATGKLTPVNEQPSYGDKPVHLSVYPTADWLFVSNFGGTLAMLTIDGNGRIGASTQQTRFEDKSQKPTSRKSHPSFSYPTGDGRFIYVTDNGLDKVIINRFDNGKGTMTPASQPWIALQQRSGPVAFLRHPGGDIAFVAESNFSSIHTFGINSNDGSLTSIMTQKTIPAGFKGPEKISEMHLHPSGHYLYAANSGHNSIAVIDVLEVNHKIKYRTSVAMQGNPVSFTIDPSGRFAFVALRDADRIAILTIGDDGSLSPAAIFEIGSPSFVFFSGAKR